MLLFQNVRNRNGIRILSRQLFQKDKFLVDALQDLPDYQALVLDLRPNAKEVLRCRSGAYLFPEEEMYIYVARQ